MLNNYFKKAVLSVAGVAAGLMMTASPAVAGKDFLKRDMQDQSRETVKGVSQVASEETVTFAVFGGTRGQQMAVYEVAQRLDDEGKAVALILGPDLDTIENTVTVAVYAGGNAKELVNAVNNTEEYSGFKSDLYAASSPVAPNKSVRTLALK